jgi:hypothetical protein
MLRVTNVDSKNTPVFAFHVFRTDFIVICVRVFCLALILLVV